MTDFKEGDRVRHESLGEGVIQHQKDLPGYLLAIDLVKGVARVKFDKEGTYKFEPVALSLLSKVEEEPELWDLHAVRADEITSGCEMYYSDEDSYESGWTRVVTAVPDKSDSEWMRFTDPNNFFWTARGDSLHIIRVSVEKSRKPKVEFFGDSIRERGSLLPDSWENEAKTVSIPVGSIPPWMKYAGRSMDKGDLKYYLFKDTSEYDYNAGETPPGREQGEFESDFLLTMTKAVTETMLLANERNQLATADEIAGVIYEQFWLREIKEVVGGDREFIRCSNCGGTGLRNNPEYVGTAKDESTVHLEASDGWSACGGRLPNQAMTLDKSRATCSNCLDDREEKEKEPMCEDGHCGNCGAVASKQLSVPCEACGTNGARYMHSAYDPDDTFFNFKPPRGCDSERLKEEPKPCSQNMHEIWCADDYPCDVEGRKRPDRDVPSVVPQPEKTLREKRRSKVFTSISYTALESASEVENLLDALEELDREYVDSKLKQREALIIGFGESMRTWKEVEAFLNDENFLLFGDN